jgi:elongation factor G
LNKIDHDGVDYEAAVRTLRERLDRRITAVTVPSAQEDGDGVVNLLAEDLPESCLPLRDRLTEEIASGDDALTEEYLAGKQISVQELQKALKSEVAAGALYPLLCCSATGKAGLRELMDFVAACLPSPLVQTGEERVSSLVFKTLLEPGTGHLNFIRIYSGTVQTGKELFNSSRQSRERTGQLVFVQGKKRFETHEAAAGDLVGIMKLKDTKTNDILLSERYEAAVRGIEFPAAVYERTLAAASREDEDKLGAAIAAVTAENPTVSCRFNSETREMLLSGMGTLQLELIADRIRSRYGIPIELRPPKVPYRESIGGRAEAQGKYKRQSGGRGQYGDCRLKVEPLERGKGFEFIDRIAGGAIPRHFIPAVEKGVREAMEQGVITGHPVVDIRVTLYDGSYHDVDSSDLAFKIAAGMALRKAVEEARPLVLEPFMEALVTVPETYTGAILGDLTARRSRITGLEKEGNRELVRALVPLARMAEYATDLRSLTRGSGRFTLRPAHYEEVPAETAHRLMDEYRGKRGQTPEKLKAS